MKKVLSIAVVFVMMVLLNTVVFADMGAPMIKGYTAVVDVVEGATLYKYKYDDNTGGKLYPAGKVDYNTEVEVQYEMNYEEGTFVSYYEDGDNTNYENEKLINVKDLKVISSKEKAEYDKESKKTGVVLAEEGIVMKSGPAEAYDDLGVIIPKGTKLTVYSEKEGYDSPWYYTEYNGNGGWICELDGVIGYAADGSFKAYMDMEITDNKGKVLGILPANTEIHDYYFLDMWSQGYYFTYNGITGSVYNREVAFEASYVTKVEVIKPGVKIYTNYYEEETENEILRKLKDVVYEEIPVGTTLEIIYDTDYAGILFIEYDGVKGWIYNDEKLESIFPGEDSVGKEAATEETEIVESEEKEEIVEVENKIEEEEKVANVIVNAETGEETTSNSGINLSTEEFILFAVCVAVAIAFTSIVTIILINRGSKKSKKEDTSKTEEIKKEE